eukprot:m.147179 g.147179  ORF g.147179 m.147179 type:complete len:889 (-) comp16823_c0_seq1:406-3072(-)
MAASDDDNEGDDEVQPSVLARKRNLQRKPRPKAEDDKKPAAAAAKASSKTTTSKLSFADDEEEDEGGAFQLKTTTAFPQAREDPDMVQAANLTSVGASSSSYSLESLKELRASQRSRPGVPKQDDAPIVVVPGEEAEAAAEASRGSSSNLPPQFAEAAADMDVDIPTEDAILAAKNRRKAAQLRLQQDEDFVPLSGAGGGAGGSSSHRSAAGARGPRLVREEDEDEGEGSDGDTTEAPMSFGEAAKRGNQQSSRLEARAVLGRGGIMPDKETSEWELQQIKKGSGAGLVGGQRVGSPASKKHGAASLQEMTRTAAGLQALKVRGGAPGAAADASGSGSGSGGGSEAGGASFFGSSDGSGSSGSHNNNNNGHGHSHGLGGGSSKAGTTAPASLEALHRKLQSTLESMREVHRSHAQHLARVTDDLAAAQAAVPLLERDLQAAGSRYTFFQEMKAYVRDLLACLNEKVPLIEGAETRTHTLLRTRAAEVVARRKQLAADKVLLVREVLASGGAEDLRTVTAKHSDIQERLTTYQARRRRRLEAGRPTDDVSTDDEQEEDAAQRFATEMSRVASDAGGVFDDVIDEYSEIKCIARRFEDWLIDFTRQYRDAFVGMSLQKILKPLVQFQLLAWNPLEPSAVALDTMPWFEDLMLFGIRDGSPLSQDDPDTQLVPDLVATVVFPKLAALIEGVWDPLSRAQSTRLVECVKSMINEYPSVGPDTEAARKLLDVVAVRLERAFKDEGAVPSFPADSLENPAVMSVRLAAFSRAFKLLDSAGQWAGVMPPASLQRLLLGFSSRLASSLQPLFSASVPMCEQVMKRLPKAWFQGDSAAVRVAQMSAAPLHLCIAKMLETCQRSPTTHRQNILQLASFLEHLGEDQEARNAKAALFAA